VRKEKVNMVVEHDFKLEEVEGMMAQTLFGQFLGKFVKGDTLKRWLVEN